MTDKSFTFARASRLKGFRAAVAEINPAECPVFEENSDKKAISYSDIELFEVGGVRRGACWRRYRGQRQSLRSMI
ncbi:hypothetical protein ACQZ5G_11540 [Agrobacterium sp. 22-214-1]